MRAILLNRYLVGFLSFILLMKLMVPIGFMPDLNALNHGTLQLVICSGSGLKNLTIDVSGHHDNGGKNSHDFCPYGAAPHAAIAPALFIFALLLVAIFVSARRNDEFLLTFAPQTAWARGPPSL